MVLPHPHAARRLLAVRIVSSSTRNTSCAYSTSSAVELLVHYELACGNLSNPDGDFPHLHNRVLAVRAAGWEIRQRRRHRPTEDDAMNHPALNTPRQGAAPRVEALPAPDAPPRPLGILIVEDERPILAALEKGLSRRGFAVWCAADGGAAIDLFRRFESQIDVVLSDLNLPVMDGLKTLDALRRINRLVRFCFMTGDTRQSTLAELRREGVLRVFTKPFSSVADLAEELRKLLPAAASAPASVVGGVLAGLA
jgi:CheY-like chemotaxis protein